MEANGIYLIDFIKLIRRNVTPCAIFHFYQPNKLHPTMGTLMDYSKRRFMSNAIDTDLIFGKSEDERQEFARVTNITIEGGMVPYNNAVGELYEDELTGKMSVKKRRVWGANAILQTLVAENIVKPTEEVSRFIHKDATTLAPRNKWYA